MGVHVVPKLAKGTLLIAALGGSTARNSDLKSQKQEEKAGNFIQNRIALIRGFPTGEIAEKRSR